MTNADLIIDFLSNRPNACDDCISAKTRVEPRQQVNQICRRLAANGVVTRSQENCTLCGGIKLTNSLTKEPRKQAPGPPPAPPPQDVRIEDLRNRLDRFCRAIARHEGLEADHLAGLISQLADRDIVPMHPANMMHTIRCLRNAYVHEHIEFGPSETAVARGAWEIVARWAQQHYPLEWGASERRHR